MLKLYMKPGAICYHSQLPILTRPSFRLIPVNKTSIVSISIRSNTLSNGFLSFAKAFVKAHGGVVLREPTGGVETISFFSPVPSARAVMALHMLSWAEEYQFQDQIHSLELQLQRASPLLCQRRLTRAPLGDALRVDPVLHSSAVWGIELAGIRSAVRLFGELGDLSRGAVSEPVEAVFDTYKDLPIVVTEESREAVIQELSEFSDVRDRVYLSSEIGVFDDG